MKELLKDNDIVKALENQANGYGAGIVGDLSALTLDLIHRQKAEIERLTEENAILKGNPPLVAGRSLGKAIREKLLMFDRMKDRLSKLIDEHDEYGNLAVERLIENEELKTKNTELQKQVDEFQDMCLDCPYKLKLDEIEKQAVKDTAKEIFTQIFESCVFSFKGNEDYKKGFCDALEQYDKQLRDLAKQNGVEVE